MPPPNSPVGPTTPEQSQVGSYTTIAGLLRSREGDTTPPSPASNLSSVTTTPEKRRGSFGPLLAYKVDLRGMTYIEFVDENLVCPICRCALIEPVTTDCDHTYCQSCIDEALSHQQACPVDRLPLSRNNYTKSPKVIYNQLDNLKAQCPCCNITLPRAMIQSHVDRYCPDSFIACPDPEENCKYVVRRKNAENGCLHYEVCCVDCQAVMMQADLSRHQEQDCTEKNTQCELCQEDILQCKRNEHEMACPEKVIPCKWEEFGCDYHDKRSSHSHHLNSCAFNIIGPMATLFKTQINSLQSEVRSLNEKNAHQDRVIKFLERSTNLTDHHLATYADLSTTLPAFPSDQSQVDPSQEYLHSLLESQEQRVNRLASDLADLDSKQTVMLFNETMPLKNEMAELRSNLQVTSTHVRFLMRLRLQENQQRRFGGWGAGGGTSGSGSPGGATPAGAASPELPLPMPGRRLSDTTRDNLTRL